MSEHLHTLIWASIGIIAAVVPSFLIVLFPFRKQLKYSTGKVLAVCAAITVIGTAGFMLLPAEYQTFNAHQIWKVGMKFPCVAWVLFAVDESKSRQLYFLAIIVNFITASIKFANYIALRFFENTGFYELGVASVVVVIALTPPMMWYMDWVVKKTPVVESSGKKIWSIIWILPILFLLGNLSFNIRFDPDVVTSPEFLIANIISVLGVIVASEVLYRTLQIATKVAAAKEVEQRLVAENATLDSLSRMKSEFVTNITHEAKTPLAVISVHVQQAREVFEEITNEQLEADSEIISDSLKKAQAELMRVSRLVNNVLEFTSKQENREQVEALDIGSLIENGTEAYRSLIEKQGNTLTIHAPADLPQILGDADQLLQVMANVLTNANNHTRDGEIKVQITNYKAQITVTITDTGTGIDPQLLPRVFERGVTGSANAGSTGMGLPISQTIIESHGGNIGIESEFGAGTRTWFSIPIYGIEN